MSADFPPLSYERLFEMFCKHQNAKDGELIAVDRDELLNLIHTALTIKVVANHPKRAAILACLVVERSALNPDAERRDAFDLLIRLLEAKDPEARRMSSAPPPPTPERPQLRLVRKSG